MAGTSVATLILGVTAVGAVLVTAGGIGFLVSLAAMARAVGIPTPDQRWFAARARPEPIESTEQILDALADDRR